MANSPQSLEAATIKASRPEWNEQELKTIVYQGVEVPGYRVAKDGLVISTVQCKKGKPLQWTGYGRPDHKYPAVKLRLPVEILSYYDEGANNTNGVKVSRNVAVHVLVANTWLGQEECPEDLKPYWDDFLPEVKEIMRSYFLIDHIDDDKHNPNLSNLKFVSSRNNHALIKGGSNNT